MKLYHELAEFYFAIEDKHRNIADEISFIRSHLTSGSKPRLLDIGCGTGEHLHHLSKYGIHCVGIDISDTMISVAKNRYPQGIEFYAMDMKDIDFYNEFDAVISLFGSINYLKANSDIDQLFWNIRRALKDDGFGIIEVWNSIPLKKIKEKKIGPVSTTVYHDTAIKRERGFSLIKDTEITVVEVNYNYTISKSSETKIIQDTHVMRAFTENEICDFLKENGFYIRGVYSNFRKEPFNDKSNKIIIHFEKE